MEYNKACLWKLVDNWSGGAFCANLCNPRAVWKKNEEASAKKKYTSELKENDLKCEGL